MERVKTGIIGCGKGAHLHAQALKNLPESLFTAVYSRNFEKAKAFAEQYGVKACSSIEEMASQAGVEAALICTPHPAHAETAVKASKAGMHVLVEKPLASSLEDCDAIINSAKDNGVKLGTICQRRFYPPSLRIKAAIDAGKIGKPILGTVNMLGWRDEAYYQSDPWRGSWKGEGGGVLVNQAPHQLDLFQWYMGPVEEVFNTPLHPYTIGLFGSIPKLEGERERLVSIPGMVANPEHLPSGCAFHTRCDRCMEVCKSEVPQMVRINDHHYVACHAVTGGQASDNS